MIEIVTALKEKHAMSDDAFGRRLGMSKAEVHRMISTLPITQKITFDKLDGSAIFSASWDMIPIAQLVATEDVDADRIADIDLKGTPGVERLGAAFDMKIIEQEKMIEEEVKRELEAKGYDKANPPPAAAIVSTRQKIIAKLPIKTHPRLKRLILYVNEEQQEILSTVFSRFIDGSLLTEQTFPAAFIGAIEFAKTLPEIEKMIGARKKKKK